MKQYRDDETGTIDLENICFNLNVDLTKCDEYACSCECSYGQ